MNLKRVITGLIAAVVILAVGSGVAWYTMGKHSVTQSSSDPVITRPQQPRR
ncbi:hypothetical protein FD13_GL000186 [Levilactobacillus senmaizukei DSM 21775 = NBRC 103853]|uniref:Uncharacterized protein n=1 Tax=Levilactobacillus senmaizukei DSM 21775 = NBRC 103853 TaxID=1423803 RepID=A0A0R2DIB6_9LACO|nr:hypothetical protein [Levilactobacillus senmaizukei]KRN03398.1 hypothetical protein FD13_GL000186 [Levilactobacillus senmaizukei DSM 21775 = NBRC 103853]